VRLRHEWPIEGYRSLQPQVIGDDRILIPGELSAGTRLIRIVRDGDELAAEEVWTSRSMKPDFNDLVVHEGHAYGFDNRVFASIDLETGERNWKGGRYGKGQVLLLADAQLLLVMGEEGQVVVVAADPAEHVELAEFQALDGKTWNHPVVIGDRLYVRNSDEAAAYRLPMADSPTKPEAAPAE
jgi:outer membrane protein assembly factor BamB